MSEKLQTWLDAKHIIEAKDELLLQALDSLLAALERGKSRLEAIETLHDLAARLAAESSKESSKESKNTGDSDLDQHTQSQLQLRIVEVPGLSHPIKLLLTPAVFSPEMWGQTFAEGLMKEPERFAGARVIELGCGSGWISLLLLFKTNVREVLGLDINPVAVTIARLNAWLNGTKPDGSIVVSQAGSPIVGSLRILRSDLLNEVIKEGELFDCIIGCIPQVLHPEKSILSQESNPEQRLTEKDLYDLSNYCFEQGILEDRFGLPLIASALEQSQLCLRPEGDVTLILGGRPGPQAIESMFARRGYKPEVLWSRRIEQADDTDLASLVALEKAHDIQFHFFLSRNSQKSVSADTAVKLLRNGHKVYHDLLVYRAVTRFEQAAFGFVRNLHELNLDSLRNELDFSRMTEEQMSFLSRLSSVLIESKTLPYPDERGALSLRSRLSRFLHIYCHSNYPPESLFIAPERRALLSMITGMLVDKGSRILVSESLREVYSDLLEVEGIETTWCNDDLSELLALDKILVPDMLLIAPTQLTRSSPITLEALFNRARENPSCYYLVDESSNFEIGSRLEANVTLRLSGQMEIPDNVVFIYGLVKNTVCPDLELSFLLNAPRDWIDGFDVAAEVSYSRIPYPSQLYYEWLFDDLLAFPFPQQESASHRKNSISHKGRKQEFEQAAKDSVFEPKPIDPSAKGVIRLDYGEIEYEVPDILVRGLIKGFVEEPGEALPNLLRQRVSSYIKATRSVMVTPDRVALGQGVFPLFGATIQAMSSRLGRKPRIAVPNGAYGVVYPMLSYYGAETIAIETDSARGFVMSAEELAVKLESISLKPDLLWLTQPNNPSGLLFESTAITRILDLCQRSGIYVMADEIFFLLSDYRLGSWTPPYLSFGSALDSQRYKDILFLTDGISKSFAAGGLRCGFLVAPDMSWAHEIQRRASLPPSALLRAWDNLYSTFLEEAPHGMLDLEKARRDLHDYLIDLRQRLSGNRDRLLSLLKEFDAADLLDTPYRGGPFLLARLSSQRIELAKDYELLINTDSWSRTPQWSRLCFSIPQNKFDSALIRLRGALERS